MNVYEKCIGMPPGNNLGELLSWVWFSPFGYMLNQLYGFGWYFIYLWIKFWENKSK